MKVTCKYCGIVNKPHHCPHNKRKTDNTRSDKKAYATKEYKAMREEVLRDYDYICLWSLYVEGKVKQAEVTHHIVEVLEDEELYAEYDNLIPLTFDNHTLIHKLYKTNKKEDIQTILRDMLNTKDKILGLFKDRVDKVINRSV